MNQTEIVTAVLEFINADSADDTAFNDLALKLFIYQYNYNSPFMRYARERGKTPRTVKSWTEIPAVPISAFKSLDLSCSPIKEAKAVFMTSGTTFDGVRGKIYHPLLDVYDASMHRNFRNRFMGSFDRIRMGILFPSPKLMPNSSLAHYLNLAVQEFGLDKSRHLMDEDGINFPALFDDLVKAEQSGTPYALLGASFSFVHVIDEMERTGKTVVLPPGSRILDTGGFKGQSRELKPDAFYDKLEATFGVPRNRCINMYGMTELSSQFYDDGNAICPSVKSGPNWLRSRVINPITGQNMPDGEMGILAHTDLAHFNICTTVLTEDTGIVVDNGFQLIGRASGIEAQGCSIAVDEFLKASSRN